MRAGVPAQGTGFGPYTVLDLYALDEDGRGLSPGSSSERTDRMRMVMEHAALGIPQYWNLEHTPHLAVQALRLDGAHYVADPLIAEGALVEATIGADKPFSFSFDPADLLAL